MVSSRTFFATAIVIGLVGCGAVTAASAQPGPRPDGWHHGSGLLDGVTLTDDQKTKLQALMMAGHQDAQALHEQMHAIREQIDTALLSSGTVTEATVAPLLQQQEALTQQMDAKRLSDEIAIRNMLTASQIATAATTHAQLVALHQQEHALHQSTGDMAPGQPD